MNILIIGDNPNISGGVCNYTRPLFNYLYRLNNNKFFYLYSACHYQEIETSFFYKHKIVQTSIADVYKIINPISFEKNYYNLAYDTSVKKTEKLITKFLISKNIHLIHINELIGIPTNIIKLAKDMGIKVVMTVHEYSLLCPHRALIDWQGKLCVGPSDFNKCSHCVLIIRGKSSSNMKNNIILKLKHDLPFVFKAMLKVKKVIMTIVKQNILNNRTNKDYFLNFKKQENYDRKLAKILSNRLELNISYLNSCDLVIGVSNDVKQTLLKYGIKKEKIIVQHIGSLIASQKIEVKRENVHNRFIFGFIGGVTYYKGIHVLVEAYLKLKSEYFDKSEILIFGKYQEDYKSAIDLKFGTQNGYKNIKFMGKFSAEDLKDIYPQIDIMVLPSTCNDTAPQTIFESYAAGIPIIGSNIGGFPDFIEHNKNGLLFES